MDAGGVNVVDVGKRRAKVRVGATRVIGYVRVSTDKQADSGLSLEAQRARLEAWCGLHGAELVRIEVDAGASAKTLERPALGRTLRALRNGMSMRFSLPSSIG
jgi:hypothetical protein